MATVSQWLPPIIASFGAVALAVACFEFVVFFMAISMCCTSNKKVDNK